MRKLLIMWTGILSVGILVAELGTNSPTDAQLTQLRVTEGGSGGSGVFDIPVPPAGTVFHPVKRVSRQQFGVVGPFPLQLQDLDGLVYPDATDDERQAMMEGVTFFTTAHPAAEGRGPMSNQPFCLGCHMNSEEAISGAGLVNPNDCIPGSTCVSIVSRAARATPTNFKVTSWDPTTGGGVAPGTVLSDGHPNPADSLDAVNGPGRTAAFTTFGDFNPNHADAANNPTGIGFFDPLDGATANIVTGATSQPFGGLVQHHRPIDGCVPKPLPPAQFDANLSGTPDPATGLDSKTGFRRSVGERAGPPYIGRGLMEAIPTADLLAVADPTDKQTSKSSLGNFAPGLGCTGDCISGKANMIPRNLTVHADSNGNVTSVTGFVGGVGRFGLRANGAEILQFIIGGAQGELSLTTLINNSEINFPTLFPVRTTFGAQLEQEPAACLAAASGPVFPAATNASTQEIFLSEPISVRNFIRNVAPPQFGNSLLRVLETANPAAPLGGELGRVQRGAQLFGIDLVAFANRMIDGKMPPEGDGRDPNAISQADRFLDCVGCHTPVQRTGQSPANVGAEHLSFVWAPIFSDLLLHKMPSIDAERISFLPRDPLVVSRVDTNTNRGRGLHRGQIFPSFDLPRSLADDTFLNQKASADGREFRTPPLMGLGRIGPPFLHDGRVYLSSLTVDSMPASTVTTNSQATNAPLVVRTLDDAIKAAIELHDLPAPDDAKTSQTFGGGCPVPSTQTNINYGASPADVICPAYSSPVSQTNRSDARQVIYRFRSLSTTDQQALIEFLKQL